MMLRTAISLACALAFLVPTAALANDRHDRRDFNRYRTIERVRTIDFYNRNRTFERRDRGTWRQRSERREVERERNWRDRRDGRRDYRRDRYRERRIIIIPHFSF